MKWIVVPMGLIAWTGYMFAGAKSFSYFQPQKWAKNMIVGNGKLKTETRAIKSYDSIVLGSAVKATFTESKLTPLTIEAEENIMPLVSTRVEGKNLLIEIKGNIETKKHIKVTGSTDLIRRIQASGASMVMINQIRSHPINLNASGASSLKLQGQPSEVEIDLSGAANAILGKLNLKRCSVNLSGASRLNMLGATDLLNAKVQGASVFDGDIIARSGTMEASGASQILINRNKNVRVTSSGESRIK